MKTRKLYQFRCEKCGKERRQSFKKVKAETGLCTMCRREALHVHKDQLPLFTQQNSPYENPELHRPESA